MAKKRVKLIVAYDGSGFCGFERQVGLVTVQGLIELAIFKVLNQEVTITPSGRTDALVHALGQVCHFDFEGEFKLSQLKNALNFYLPNSIRVLSAEEAPFDFNARRTFKKTYFYDVAVSQCENPLLVNRAWTIKNELDVGLVRTAMEMFLGTHDFENFRCIGSSAKTTVRTIHSFDLECLNIFNERVYRFFICADGFLYKMVRIIVASIVKVGEKKLSLSELLKQINLEVKVKSKFPAPAYGLYLDKVEYL